METHPNLTLHDMRHAMLIAMDTNLYPGHPEHFSEYLHKTLDGHFFLLGIGGANTDYGRRRPDDSYLGGKRITYMTKEQARTWCVQRNLQNALDHHFADME